MSVLNAQPAICTAQSTAPSTSIATTINYTNCSTLNVSIYAVVKAI